MSIERRIEILGRIERLGNTDNATTEELAELERMGFICQDDESPEYWVLTSLGELEIENADAK